MKKEIYSNRLLIAIIIFGIALTAFSSWAKNEYLKDIHIISNEKHLKDFQINKPQKPYLVSMRNMWDVRIGYSARDYSGKPFWLHEEASNNNWSPVKKISHFILDENLGWVNYNFWSSNTNDYWFKIKLPNWKNDTTSILIYDLPLIQEVYLNQKRLFNKDTGISSNLLKKSWIQLVLPPSEQEQNVLYIKYNITKKSILHNIDEELLIGDPNLIGRYLMEHNFDVLILGLFFCFIGISSFLFYLKDLKSTRLLTFGLFTLSLGFLSLMFHRVFYSVIEDSYFYFWFLGFVWPIAMMAFFQDLFSARQYSLIGFCKWAHIVLAVITVPIEPYSQSLFPYFGLMIIFLNYFSISVVLLSAIQRAIKGNRDAWVLFVGILFFMASSVISMILGVFVIHIGMFIFISSLIIILQQRFIDSKVKLEIYSKELDRKNKELMCLDELKDHFLTNTTHELKTPLHGIIGITESILDSDEIKNTPAVSKSLGRIVSSAKRLSKLINDILDTARLKENEVSIEKKPVDISLSVDHSLTILTSLAKNKEIRLENEIPKNEIIVMADKDRLQQILQNLIGNAIKYTNTGTVSISAILNNKFAKILVKDTGVGIENDHLEMIFSPFTRISSSTGKKPFGTGLGLSITKRLVELHDGIIQVESVVNQGTTVTFTLPLTHLKPEDQSEGIWKTDQLLIDEAFQKEEFEIVPLYTKSVRHPYNILVVDDEPLNLHIITNQLNALPVNIIPAASGKEALDIVAQNKPDLILLDVMMPHIDGFQTCKLIREKEAPADLPVLFLTARDRENDIIEGFAAGGNDYLTKPFSKRELMTRVGVQLTLVNARRRMKALSGFANKISQYNNVEQLLIAGFDLLCQENFVNDGALFHDSKSLCFLIEKDNKEILKSYKTFEKNGYEDSITTTENILVVQVPELKDYVYILQVAQSLTDHDKDYISSIVDQIVITRLNFSNIVKDQRLLSIISFISASLDKTLFIKSSDKYCKIHLDEDGAESDLLRISLKEIKLHVNSRSLLQVHRSYLVNPKKVTGIRKKKRTYELFVGNEIVPIGLSYIPQIKDRLPELRKSI